MGLPQTTDPVKKAAEGAAPPEYVGLPPSRQSSIVYLRADVGVLGSSSNDPPGVFLEPPGAFYAACVAASP